MSQFLCLKYENNLKLPEAAVPSMRCSCGNCYRNKLSVICWCWPTARLVYARFNATWLSESLRLLHPQKKQKAKSDVFVWTLNCMFIYFILGGCWSLFDILGHTRTNRSHSTLQKTFFLYISITFLFSKAFKLLLSFQFKYIILFCNFSDPLICQMYYGFINLSLLISDVLFHHTRRKHSA